MHYLCFEEDLRLHGPGIVLHPERQPIRSTGHRAALQIERMIERCQVSGTIRHTCLSSVLIICSIACSNLVLLQWNRSSLVSTMVNRSRYLIVHKTHNSLKDCTISRYLPSLFLNALVGLLTNMAYTLPCATVMLDKYVISCDMGVV